MAEPVLSAKRKLRKELKLEEELRRPARSELTATWRRELQMSRRWHHRRNPFQKE
jgi:hypothetical protein